MPRNSASGANKQRKRPQREDSGRDARGRFRAQPGHTDPNLRLDGQRLEQSFEHLERTKKPTRVVGLQGWKTETSSLEPKAVPLSHEKVIQSSHEKVVRRSNE